MTKTNVRLSSIDRAILNRTINIKQQLVERYQSYLADCEADRKRGYRAHYCEHGTNQWTDYDNICGPCEDGLTLGDPVFRQQLAHREAEAEWEAETKEAANPMLWFVMFDETMVICTSEVQAADQSVAPIGANLDVLVHPIRTDLWERIRSSVADKGLNIIDLRPVKLPE